MQVLAIKPLRWSHDPIDQKQRWLVDSTNRIVGEAGPMSAIDPHRSYARVGTQFLGQYLTIADAMSAVYSLVDKHAANPPTESFSVPMTDDELTLRRLLATRVAGALLYVDDGELQDSSMMPVIDFKRDAAQDIAHKLVARNVMKAKEKQNEPSVYHSEG